MTKKIDITEREIEVIHLQLDGKLELFTGQDEEMEVICNIVKRADKLMHETNAYDDVGDDLVEWYWNLYQDQEKEIHTR